MSAPLVIAVPSKGRLQENTEAFFGRAGLQLVKPRGARDYRGAIADLPGVEVAYLSAAEIADALAQGSIHLGITGEDLLRESIADMDKRVVVIEGLGFGFANVVVAVPQAWIDVRSMADLDDVATAFRLRHDRKMRVATKYVNLTRDFFSAQGIVDYRIVESSGATEGAPAAGSAELIVDISTTGSTLAANGLKMVDDGTILRSQASLVAARGAAWGDARARDRAPHPRPYRRAGTRPRLSRGAHALPRLRRGHAGAGQSAVRRGCAVRRADLVRHADAALSRRRRSTISQASCASAAHKASSSPRSNTCSPRTIRSTPGSSPDCKNVDAAWNLWRACTVIFGTEAIIGPPHPCELLNEPGYLPSGWRVFRFSTPRPGPIGRAFGIGKSPQVDDGL